MVVVVILIIVVAIVVVVVAVVCGAARTRVMAKKKPHGVGGAKVHQSRGRRRGAPVTIGLRCRCDRHNAHGSRLLLK